MSKNIYQCKNCNQSFEPKDKRFNKFCSSSCSASYNNVGRIRSEESKKKTSLALSGRKLSDEHKQKIKKGKSKPKLSRVFVPCPICNDDMIYIVGAKNNRHTCGKRKCINKVISIKNQHNLNCGGKRNSHKHVISNLKKEEFTLESSYELQFANKLNDMNVYWIRPTYFWYEQNGIKRRYYPDFYVPEWDTYYDPKNDYLIVQDAKKIKLVMEQNDIMIVVLSKLDIDNFEK